MTLESYGTILGVLGFAISVYNLFSAIRSRTVNPQPPLLAELGGYLELTAKACQQLRPQLNFDRHLLHTGHRPQINPRPAEFDTAISRMPELGRTVTSIGQHQIALLTVLINNVSHNWDVLNSCVISDPVNVSALEFSQKLKRQTRMVERFFPIRRRRYSHQQGQHMEAVQIPRSPTHHIQVARMDAARPCRPSIRTGLRARAARVIVCRLVREETTPVRGTSWAILPVNML